MSPAVLSAPVLQPSDVFEQPHPAGQKRIEFHISVPEGAATAEESGPGQPDDGGGGKSPVSVCDPRYSLPDTYCLFCFCFLRIHVRNVHHNYPKPEGGVLEVVALSDRPF